MIFSKSILFRFSIFIFILSLAACCDRSELPKNSAKLYSPVAKDRNQAAQALARCAEDAADFVPRLAELMYDENVGVQSSAAYALRKIDTALARQYLEQAEKKRRQK